MPEKASLVPIDNFGDLIALQEENKTLTYAQLQQEVKKRAARLKQYSILPGERIAYPFPSSIDSVVNYLSIIESGATAVLLDPHLPKEDLRKLILHSEPVALIGDFDLEIPCLKVEDLSSKTPYKKPQVETPPDPEVAMILYTSGTTGDYKGVLLTHDNVSHAIFLAKTVCEYPLGPGVPVECFLPIYHVFPLIVNILSFLSAGATIRFHPITDVGKVLQQGLPFATTIVPRVLELLDTKIKEELHALSFFAKLARLFRKKVPRYFMCGGAPLALSTHKDLLKYGFSIQIGYGLTETCAAATVTQGTYKFNSVGQIAPSLKMRIDHPNELGEGEVCLQGKTIMKGYFKDPAATREVLQDGWFHTGDLGHIDDEGYLFITGRIKEIIVLPSGKKAMPSDVEAHYKNIRGVKELAVVGIQPKNHVGEEIHAAVVPENPQTTLEEIEKEIFTRSKTLEPHLTIQKIHLVTQIPRTTTLKPRRALIKKMLSEETFIRKVTHPISSDPIHQWIGHWITQNTDLKLSEIDETQLFISLGLDSLKMMQLCEDLSEEYQIDITLLDLDENANIQTLAAFCAKNQGSGTKTSSITPVDHTQPQPLSFIEESIWTYGREPWANFLLSFDFYGPLDATALKRALKDLFKRHEILRTTYTATHRQIHPDFDTTYEFIDLSTSNDQTTQIIQQKQQQRIDPSSLPLFFLTLVKLSDTHHLWILLTSRLILDGASFYLLFEDLSLLYKNHLEKIPTPPLAPPITYADFAAWQKNTPFAEQEAYWQEAFKTMEPLVLTQKTLPRQELPQKEIPFLLPELLCRQLEGIATHNNSSLQTLLFAAYQIALYKFTNQRTFTSRIVTMGRRRTQLQSVIGHLAGSLPIQNDFTQDLPFDTFLLLTQKKLTEATVHSDILGETLVERYGHLAKKPPQISFNVSFNYYSFAKPLQFPNLKVAPHPLPSYLYPPGLDLDCVLMPINKEIYGLLSYRQALFDENTLAPLVKTYIKILNQIAYQATTPISQLGISK